MLPTILVPLDGSTLAERAVPVAAALARATGWRLRLIAAVRVTGLPGFDMTEAQLTEMTAAETYLQTQAQELAGQGLVAERSAIFAPAAKAILEEAALLGAGLIVMATHGRGGLGRLIAGSTAREVLAKSPIPVLLVRAWHAQRAVERLDRGARIVVPLDGSAEAEGILPTAERLAAALRGELVLVQAIAPTDTALTPDGMAVALFHEDTTERLAFARDYLDHLAGRLGAKECPVSREARVGVPAATIDAIAREHGAALIVMATHGRTGVDRLLLGSVAEAVVREGSTPVLLVRAGMPIPAAGKEHAQSAAEREEDFPTLQQGAPRHRA